jgi:hypothetical protein
MKMGKRMPSSGMLQRVAPVRIDVLEERIAPIIRMTRNGKLRTLPALLSSVRRVLVTANVVPSSPILVTLMTEAIRFLQEQHGVTSQKTAFFILQPGEPKILQTKMKTAI